MTDRPALTREINMDILELQRNVRDGAELLDNDVVGWAERIDVATLDMADGELCILGQLYGDSGHGYDVGLDALGLSMWDDEDEDHGFSLPASEGVDGRIPDVAWEELRQLWIFQIILRTA